jgi:hypothetical protein
MRMYPCPLPARKCCRAAGRVDDEGGRNLVRAAIAIDVDLPSRTASYRALQ